jgi:putative flippase GtrA
MNAVLLPLLVEYAGLGVVPAQVVATVLAIASTYVAHRYFSFRRPG